MHISTLNCYFLSLTSWQAQSAMSFRTVGAAWILIGLLQAGGVPDAAFGQGAAGGRQQAGPSQGQVASERGAQRPPVLDIEYHRAEMAWKSGTSVLEAKARLDRVLRKLPDDQEALRLRAEVLLGLDRPEEALADAQRAAELRPSDGEAHLILSEAARRSSRPDLARRALGEAAAHLTNDAMLHVRLSWNAVLLEQPERAEAYARIALAQDEKLPEAYYQLARVFARNGKRDEAAAVLARGLRASVVEPGAIQADTTLRQLVDHAALRPLMSGS